MPRSVVTGVPYHVTQRGNRQQAVFFSANDRARYLAWLREYADRYDLDVWAYCLMENHIHLVALPRTHEGLARTLQTVHMRHTQAVNTVQGWSGHLWQGRFFATALDEESLWSAVQYVEQNPVRAGLVHHAQDYAWSSAAFHCGERPDPVIPRRPPFGVPIEDWELVVNEPQTGDVSDRIRKRTQTGFPCGDDAFISRLSGLLGRHLVERQRGRPRRDV